MSKLRSASAANIGMLVSGMRRVALVTGASTGIGLETAHGLAQRGFSVVLCGRHAQRLEGARTSVQAIAPSAEAQSIQSDFASLAQVHNLARDFLSRFHRLDVLINNAGTWVPKRRESVDGHEYTFAVNHLAPFLLTELLLPLLKETGRRSGSPSRVVFVSSRLHRRPSEFPFGDVHNQRRYRGIVAYAQSKLANVMYANELARRMRNTEVTSNSLHPGEVATHIVRHHPILRHAIRFARPFLQDPARGAKPSIFVATSPELKQTTGAYFHACKMRAPNPYAQREDAQDRLRALCVQLTRASQQTLLERPSGPTQENSWTTPSTSS